MIFAKTPVVGKMKNVGKVIKNTAVVAFVTIPLLIAPSCQNDKVGTLIKERAALERKIDSVGKVYKEKKDALKFTVEYQDEPKLTYMTDMLSEKEKKAIEPFVKGIDSINNEFRKYNVFGESVFSNPSK